MQGRSCRTTYRLFHGEDRSEARMSSVTILIPARHRLDHEKDKTNRRNGIQWTPWRQLEDLDLADDLALLSHSHQQMQETTEKLNTVSTQLGLNINISKTKIMKANTKNNKPITLNGEPLEETDSFTYLGSTINKNGRTEEDVKARIQKARVVFITLRNIWRAKQSKLTPN